MKRWKRLTIFRIALALTAVAAIMPVTAQAKPTPADNPVLNPSVVVLGSDDRPLSKATPQSQAIVVQSPDDRNVSRATSLDTTPIAVDDGSGIDVGIGAGMGLFLVLFAVTGTALLIRHNHKEKLSPA